MLASGRDMAIALRNSQQLWLLEQALQKSSQFKLLAWNQEREAPNDPL